MAVRKEEHDTAPFAPQNRAALGDGELVARIQAGEVALLELIMRRYNQRLFRIARGILRDDGEAEDIVQETYLQAYAHLDTFQGPNGFGRWLCRIAVNQALMRARRADWQTRAPVPERPGDADQEPIMNRFPSASPTPEDTAQQGQIRALLQDAIDTLPETYRVTFILREVEQMSVAETADCLGIDPGTVKTRTFRARHLLQRTLSERIRTSTTEAFGFAGHRCERIVERVFSRLAAVGVPCDRRSPLPPTH